MNQGSLKIQKFAREKIIFLLLEVGFELGSPLKTILRSERSYSELAGPSKNNFYKGQISAGTGLVVGQAELKQKYLFKTIGPVFFVCGG